MKPGYSNMSTLEYFLLCFSIASVMWLFTLYPSTFSRPVVEILPMNHIVPVWEPDTTTLIAKAAWCKANKECLILARTGYFEARSESLLGIWSVMHVVMNRVRDPRWGNSIESVVNWKHAFSYRWDGSEAKGVRNKKAMDKMLVAAYHVVHGEVESPVGDSKHYHADYVRPYWSKRLEYVATVGRHHFYN